MPGTGAGGQPQARGREKPRARTSASKELLAGGRLPWNTASAWNASARPPARPSGHTNHKVWGVRVAQVDRVEPQVESSTKHRKCQAKPLPLRTSAAAPWPTTSRSDILARSAGSMLASDCPHCGLRQLYHCHTNSPWQPKRRRRASAWTKAARFATGRDQRLGIRRLGQEGGESPAPAGRGLVLGCVRRRSSASRRSRPPDAASSGVHAAGMKGSRLHRA
jgi:hypothetical protein